MQTRPVPSSGELLPVIGCGTYGAFDVSATAQAMEPLGGVLRALFSAGGSVVDSSPMYGRAEAATGRLLAAMQPRPRAFVATKVWTSGRESGVAQMEDSARLLATPVIDLMQVHNLLDLRTHLKTLRAWKEQGRVRYIGVTHYTASAHADVERVMRAEALDFVQINYSAAEPEAAQRLLPLAAERGMAVLVNRPFGGAGGLMRRLAAQPLPGFAAELGCTSWAQLLLKFILARPQVTCVIPGTGEPAHMLDDVRAGEGPLPGAAECARILEEVKRR